MGFGQALSGLNAAAQNLDVIGNNIANASTVGFKAGTANFADVYSTARIGLGVQVTSINQRFTSGNLDVTGNQYDMAIDGGEGFFRLVSTNGEILYSRNGQFIKDKDNNIVNAQGQLLTGYPTGEIGGIPVPIKVPIGNIEPNATTAINVAAMNLDGTSAPIDELRYPFDPDNPATFTSAVPTTVYDSLGNPHQLLQYFVKREAGAVDNNWDVYYRLDGKDVEVGTPAIPLQPAEAAVNFDLTSLELQTGERVVEYSVSGRKGYALIVDGDAAATPPVPDRAYHLGLNAADLSTDPGSISLRRGSELTGTAAMTALASADQVTQGAEYRAATPEIPAVPESWGTAGHLSFDLNGRLMTAPMINLRVMDPGIAGSPADDLNIAINYDGTTQFGLPFSQNLIQDGYASGDFTSIAVARDGTIVANYTNGKAETIGTIALAKFNNVSGLTPVGGNAWTESPESGTAILGQPGTNGLASIMGQAVESSNVDMSQELVNMIIAQRTYQANAQTIKTQDQILQTLMQLR